MDKKNIKKALVKTYNNLKTVMPMFIAMVLLVNLIKIYVIPHISGITNGFFGYFFADVLGSIFAGNAITAYIIGNELYKSGITIGIVTTFIVAWTTVGLVQLPAEATILGKRFTLVRNILAFISAILMGVLLWVIF